MRSVKEYRFFRVAGLVLIFVTPSLMDGVPAQTGGGGRDIPANKSQKANNENTKVTSKNSKATNENKAGSPTKSPSPSPTRNHSETGEGVVNQKMEGQPAQLQSSEQKVAQTDQTGDVTNIATSLRMLVDKRIVIGGLGVVTLGLITLGFFMLLDRIKRIEAAVNHTEQPPTDNTQSNDAHNVSNQDETGKPLQADEHLTPLSVSDGEVNKMIADLIRRVQVLEKRLQPDEELLVEAHVIPDVQTLDAAVETPSAIQPPAHITVDKMLEWAKNAGFRLEAVKATLGLFGNLSQFEEGDNWLANGTPVNEQSYLFPRVDRFESESHYRSAYRDYYNCERPSAGTILIDRPAIVTIDKEQDGWKLLDKGKLSVAS